MSFYVRHRHGGNDSDPPLESFGALLDEVDEDPSDQEHISVSVVHESDWAPSRIPGLRVTYENVEELDFEPRHLEAGSDRKYVLRLMRAAAEGDRQTHAAQTWIPGYGPR